MAVWVFSSADLDVGDPRVVVDHCVEERGADRGPVVLATVPGPAGGRLGVVPAVEAAEERWPPPSGMLPNLVTSRWSIEPG
jgi:hypothetical protein